MINKISLIGSGNMGGTLAHLAMLKNLGDIILFDIIEGLPQGKSLDLCQCKPIEGIDNRIFGTNDYSDIIDSNVIIVTAGVSYKTGISQNDLLEINARIMLTVGSAIREHCPEAFVVCITDPTDVMIRILQESSGVKDNMIVGIDGVLNSSRFCMHLAWEFDISINNIQTCILGNRRLVPLIDMTTIGGMALKNILEDNKIKESRLNHIIERTKNGEKEITDLIKTHSSFYAPATAAISIITSYIFDQKRILNCTTKLKIGKYGISNSIFLTTPVKIGAAGVEEVFELKLSKQDQIKLKQSIDFTIELNNLADKLLH